MALNGVVNNSSAYTNRQSAVNGSTAALRFTMTLLLQLSTITLSYQRRITADERRQKTAIHNRRVVQTRICVTLMYPSVGKLNYFRRC